MTFAGFPKDAPQFLHELSLEMNREWFEANKPRYQQVWLAPMTALLDELHAGLAKTYQGVKLAEPKLFRIHRDTRFSKDKSPYKTHVAGAISTARSTAIYIHLGIDEEFVGAGTYFFEDAQLPRWRKLVAADKPGKDVAALVGKLRKAGYGVGGHDDYKKVPKPFPQDHPRAELLKLRGLTGAFPPIPRGMLHKPALSKWMLEHAKKLAPLVIWLDRNVK